jgi:hypothetical protein
LARNPESATRTRHEKSSRNAYNGTLSPTGKHAAGDGYLCWDVDILGTADSLDALGKCQEPARLRISPFLGSITGVFPIILSLLRCSDDETPKAVGFVVAGYSIIVALMSAAFLLLMVVLKQYTTIAAFSLGVCLVGISSTATVGVAIWNSVLRWRKGK